MGSIAPITKALKNYINNLKAIKTEDQTEFDKLVASAKDSFVKDINDVRDKYPESIYLNYPSNLSEKDAESIIARIEKSVDTNYSLPIIPSDEVVFNRYNERHYCDSIVHEHGVRQYDSCGQAGAE